MVYNTQLGKNYLTFRKGGWYVCILKKYLSENFIGNIKLTREMLTIK
jgi:hypothetical protein